MGRNLSPSEIAPRVYARYNERTEDWMLRIERIIHGNTKASVINSDFVNGVDYQTLRDCAQTVGGLIGPGAKVLRGEGEKQRSQTIHDFRGAMDWLISDAERTVARQRYKGLGEMNPSQLWETTMDSAQRRLLKVQIDDGITADGIFTTLMGDDVEPRRAFIEANALIARNIDV